MIATTPPVSRPSPRAQSTTASRAEIRSSLPRSLFEMKLQLSNLVDETKTVPIGKMLGAEVLIVGKLVFKEGEAELFAWVEGG